MVQLACVFICDFFLLVQKFLPKSLSLCKSLKYKMGIFVRVDSQTANVQ